MASRPGGVRHSTLLGLGGPDPRYTTQPPRTIEDSSLLLWSDDASPRTVVHEPVAILRVLAPGGPAREIPLLPGGALTIGRAPDVDVAIQHRSVSRRHLQLRVEPGYIIATDLGSLAGTFVDGVRIAAPTPLPIGAKIALGDQWIEIAPFSDPDRTT